MISLNLTGSEQTGSEHTKAVIKSRNFKKVSVDNRIIN